MEKVIVLFEVTIKEGKQDAYRAEAPKDSNSYFEV